MRLQDMPLLWALLGRFGTDRAEPSREARTETRTGNSSERSDPPLESV